MDELLLMNPDPVEKHGKRVKGNKGFEIVFPKNIRRLKANDGSIEKYANKKLPLVGVTGKHIAGAVGGAAATTVLPKMLKLTGWKDIAASGIASIAGGSLLKHADKEAGDAFLYTGLGVTGLKVVNELIKLARGDKTKTKAGTTRTSTQKTTTKPKPPAARSIQDIGSIDYLSDAELDALLGEDYDTLLGEGEDFVLDNDDLLGALNAGIGDLGQDVILP